MKKLLLTVAVSTIAALPGHAAAQSDSTDRFATTAEIPAPLLQGLGRGGAGRGVYRENYIVSVMEPLRRVAADGMTLGEDDIQRLTARNESQRKRENMRNILQNDMNFDGIVTKDEIIATYNEQRREHSAYITPELQTQMADQLYRHIEEQMKLDTDKDGKITLAEMAVVPEKRVVRIEDETTRYKDLLALDPDKSGKLTAAELEALAHKAFNTVDTDSNGILSPDESKAISEMVREAERRQRSVREAAEIREKCKIPTPKAEEQIIVAGVYEGDTASNISVADQTETTDIVTVTVEPGDKKIHLTASAFKPVIWQFSGATDRIARLVVAGPSLNPGTDNNDSGGGPVNAGVTGIAKDKIAFVRARDCGMQGLYEVSEKRGQRSLETLAAVLGRAPDHTGGTYSPLGLSIGGADGVVTVSADRKDNRPPPPAQYDAAAWETFVRFQPGGLANIKAEDVISEAPVVAYKVMPGWAGIAQLVGEGALVPLPSKGQSMEIVNEQGGSIVIEGMAGDDAVITSGVTMRKLSRPEGFRVVKDIPYFPTGLYGAHSTAFVIGEGVKKPANKAGHSRIITEAEYKAGKGLRHGD